MSSDSSNEKPVHTPVVRDFPITKSAITLYSEELAEKILELYSDGISLSKIGKLPEMPAAQTLYKWLRDNKWFKERFEAARALRALLYEEKALEAAENADNKDDVPAERLRFDAYKWAAEVGDPSRYGKRTTIEGNPDKPVTFVISTGFPEPNEFQKAPTLGKDGLVQKEVIEVVSEAVTKEDSTS